MNGLAAALAAPASRRSTTGRGAIPGVWRGTIVETYDDGTVAALVPSLLADQAVRMPCAITTPAVGDLVIIGAVEGRSGDFIVIGSETKPVGSATHRHPWSDLDNVPATFAPAAHTHAYGSLTGIPASFVPAAHTHVAVDISDSTALGRTLLKVADAASARAAIGAGTSSLALGTTAATAKPGDYVPAWTEVTGKPSTFAPGTHGHTYADISGLVPTSALPPLAINETFPVGSQAAMLALVAQRGDVAIRSDVLKSFILSTDNPGTLADWKEFIATGQVVSVAGKTGVVLLVKADVGLDQVDNISDLAKPVSTATQTALNLKAPLASPAFTGTPTGITKTHVGLGSVDNTTDAAKPISTATQTALDLKAPLASPAFTGTPTGITKTHVGLSNADNTADTAKPVSTATSTALGLKLDTSANRAQQTANKPETDAPSTYPLGLSYFGAGSGDGYPAGLGTVTTLRNAVSRSWQTITGKLASDVWVRSETDGDVWTAWKKLATDAAATASVAGLMSAADKTKLDAATYLPTGSTLALRHATGSIHVVTGTAADDAANKGYVDGKTWDGADITTGTVSASRLPVATGSVPGTMSAADKTKLDAATVANTASTLMLRDTNGAVNVSTPTLASHATRKDYADGLVAKLANAVSAGTVAVPVIAAGATTTVAITYPASRFAVAPILTVDSGEGRVTVGGLTAHTATGATITFANYTAASSAAATGRWHAVQMTASTAAG